MAKLDRISFTALAVFSFLILTLSGGLGTPVIRAAILAVIAATAILMFFFEGEGEGKLSLIDWAFVVYGLWIVISGAIHTLALYTLPHLFLVNVLYETRDWALSNTVTHTVVYLLFPLFFLSARIFFRNQQHPNKVFYWLPLFFLPSLLVAGYQAHFNIAALNQPFFAKLGQASGLATHSNALGMLVYLIFPVSLLAAFFAEKRFLKMAAVLCMILVLVTFQGIGSRTALAGMVLLIIASPVVVSLFSGKLSGRRKVLLGASPVALLLCAVLLAASYYRVGGKDAGILTTRLDKTIHSFEKGGVNKVLDDRLLYWKPALNLSLESPVSGWGPGGFYRELPNERFREKDKGTQRDNATSQYLQMSADFGVLGLIFNSLLYLTPIILGLSALKKIEVRTERWTVAAIVVICSIMMVLFITGPHTMALDVRWVMCLLLAYLTVEAERHGIAQLASRGKALFALACVITVIFAGGSWTDAFGRNGYEGRYSARWWPIEKGDLGGYPSQEWQRNNWEIYHGDKDQHVRNSVDSLNGNAFDVLATGSGYLLKNNDMRYGWNNSKQFFLKWSMEYSRPFIIDANVKTNDGMRNLEYRPVNRDHLGKGIYIQHGLGSDSVDGEWHTYVRNLEKDLQEAQPGVRILSVNTVMIRGSGYVDDIMLCSTPKCKNPTVYEDGENWGIDDDIRVCGLVTQRNFKIAKEWKIGNYENKKNEGNKIEDGRIEKKKIGNNEDTSTRGYGNGKWEIALSVLADDPDILEKPVTVKIYHGERLLDTLKLTSASWKKWTYPLTPDLVTKLRKTGEDVARLKFVVNRTFKDKKGRDIGLYVRRTTP